MDQVGTKEDPKIDRKIETNENSIRKNEQPQKQIVLIAARFLSKMEVSTAAGLLLILRVSDRKTILK